MEKDAKLRGISLKESDFKEGKVLFTTSGPASRYAWDAGVAVGRFLEGMKEGKLLGTKCNKCGRVVIPPRMFCELCFKEADEWVELADTGTVNTFSLCYVTWNMIRVKKPEIPAVIEIDGASEGIGIMHMLGEVDPKKVKIGMKVKAVWKPEAEREGSITDIKYFKPVE